MASPSEKLFVRKIEQNARLIPTNIFARVPLDDWETNGYRSITWKQYNDGINKIAHWLDETLGKSVDNDTVSYFGANDIRYAFIFAALNKTNRKLLTPDGRLMKGALHGLLSASNCKAWLYTEDEIAAQTPFGLEETGIVLQAFPSLEWCLEAEDTTPYPYTKTYEEHKLEEILIIHTSGTTGPPKPIYMNNGFWAAACASPQLAKRNWPRGICTEELYGRSLILACPMRWNSGLILTNAFGVFANTCCVLPPADAVGLPPAMFDRLTKLNHVEGLVATPFTVVELFNDVTTRPTLQALEFVTYLGARLDKVVGDALVQHTRLGSVIGATETGGRFSFLPRDKRFWHTYDFIPEAHVRLVPIDKSGLPTNAAEGGDVHRMFIDRPEGDIREYMCAFWNVRMFEGVDTIDTKELWRPVDCDGEVRWEFFARADDSVKLFGGVSFDAAEFETPIARHPGIRHVFVGGAGRPAPFVILDMYEEAVRGRDRGDVAREIWETVVEPLNRQVVKEIRIPVETVMVAAEGRPLPLSLKQLVLRTRAEEEYKAEIEAAYGKLNEEGQDSREKFAEFMK
ncbi:Putative AMP-dependent synthetase/ligase domain, AMP-binding, ANL domain-containing protein [Colletotrichum destructivum]|uniref:AMP-dependent synthetase/ligase domain, AMP-binding, ANL domain-containing protein n=1 Tax=Colletotrichum destructivum TaxID=34406 RepID=A0AAX4IXK8_9PEZI|nr:Putative AMP-dependent synthetase/ligase domain, AMP-binding, ANL domain-containing protein [Colletotrichum destructivum]